MTRIFIVFLAIFCLSNAQADVFMKNKSLVEPPVSTATSGGTTTLTVTSTKHQRFTGTAVQTVVLPDATTLSEGRAFVISNRSTLDITVQFDDTSLAETVVADAQTEFRLADNGTSNGVWDISTSGDGITVEVDPAAIKIDGSNAPTADIPWNAKNIVDVDTVKRSDDAVADANPADTVTVQGGNKTAGTGAGGDVELKGGTSAGGNAGVVRSHGTLEIADQVPGNVNQLLFEDTGGGGTKIHALDNQGWLEVHGTTTGKDVYHSFFTFDKDGTKDNFLEIFGKYDAGREKISIGYDAYSTPAETRIYTAGSGTSTPPHMYLEFGYQARNLGVEDATSVTVGAGVLRESDNATADAVKADTLTVRGGNKDAGTGDGGDLDLQGGTSAGGTAGIVKSKSDFHIDNDKTVFLNSTSGSDFSMKATAFNEIEFANNKAGAATYHNFNNADDDGTDDLQLWLYGKGGKFVAESHGLVLGWDAGNQKYLVRSEAFGAPDLEFPLEVGIAENFQNDAVKAASVTVKGGNKSHASSTGDGGDVILEGGFSQAGNYGKVKLPDQTAFGRYRLNFQNATGTGIDVFGMHDAGWGGLWIEGDTPGVGVGHEFHTADGDGTDDLCVYLIPYQPVAPGPWEHMQWCYNPSDASFDLSTRSNSRPTRPLYLKWGTNKNIGIEDTSSVTIGVGTVREETNATADANQADSLTVRGGNKTAGSGDGGDLKLAGGTSSGGSRGNVHMQESGGRVGIGATTFGTKDLLRIEGDDFPTLTLNNIGTSSVDTTSIAQDVSHAGANGGIGGWFGSWQGTFVTGIKTFTGTDTVNHDEGWLAFYSNPGAGSNVVEAMRIDKNGNIGIGNAITPTEELHIIEGNDPEFKIQSDDTTSTNIEMQALRTGTDEIVGKIDFNWNPNSVVTINAKSGDDTSNRDDGYLTFETAEGGSLQERMRIEQNGKIGINETVPDELLHITEASGPAAIKLESTSSFGFLYSDSNPSATDQAVMATTGRWNGNSIAGTVFRTGDDTGGKDEGYWIVLTRGAGDGVPFERLRVEQDGEVIVAQDLTVNENIVSEDGQIYSEQFFHGAASGTTDNIDWNHSNSAKLDLELYSGDVTITFFNPQAGGNYVVLPTQGSTARNLIWPGNVKWPGGTAPTITVTNNAVDKIEFYYDGTNYYGTFDQDFQ